MDVIIPGHNLKIVSAALNTLSKIGKHLYIEFDPLVGLTFRTLNDGKSSFAEFQFDVGFFERCSSPPGSRLHKRVRSRSSGTAGGGQQSSATLNNGRRGRRKRNRAQRETEAETPNQSQTQDDDMDNEKYLCRVLIKNVSAIMKSRRGLQSLRIRSLGNSDSDMTPEDHDENTIDSQDQQDNDLRMQLSFEFRIQSDGIMRITHKVAVSEAESVVADASRTGCSEIVAAPRVLLKMIDPVKSSEVALIVNDYDKRVTATSFHYADAAVSKNLVLNATAATVLKTETSIGCDEFDEFMFSDGNGEDAPEGVEDEVALVFSMKEAKAMIQFCAQASVEEELKAIVSFHWGGRPLVIETEGDAYKAELILSTVSHGLLKGVDLSSRGKKQRNRNGSLGGARNGTSNN